MCKPTQVVCNNGRQALAEKKVRGGANSSAPLLLFAPLARNSVPDHVDATVVLQGPITIEKARIAAAMARLQRGSTNRVALSLPKESDWGEEMATVVRSTSGGRPQKFSVKSS
jgi:hypothetical protein